jgi:hypothetical protein
LAGRVPKLSVVAEDDRSRSFDGGLRLATYGTGRLATEVLRQLRGAPHSVVLAAVHNPGRANEDLGELTMGEPLGVRTTADLGALDGAGVDVMLYAGLVGETHEQVMQQCAEAGVDVIHTCFAHPRIGLAPEVRERVGAALAASGARILGTGILPGLLLDVLPAALAGGLPDPVAVEARIVSNLATWGEDVLRKELGVGSTEPGTAWRYDAIVRESALELVEALRLELDLDDLRSEGGLVMSAEPGQVGPIEIAAGQVEGFEQRVIGGGADRTAIDLTWLAVPKPQERGLRPGLELTLTGGDGGSVRVGLQWTGDPYPGTAARMLKSIDPLRRMPPGFHLPAGLALT